MNSSTMNQPPSLLKIIKIDYIFFLALIFPVILWALFLFFVIYKYETITLPLPLSFGGITIIALAILAWRWHIFSTVFTDGLEIQGVITDVDFFRDRGRVSYVYSVQGSKMIGGAAVMKTKETKELIVGQPVTLVVDRSHLKRAFIKALYL